MPQNVSEPDGEAAAFWAAVRDSMGRPTAKKALERETALLAGTTKDGLEPEEWPEIPASAP